MGFCNSNRRRREGEAIQGPCTTEVNELSSDTIDLVVEVTSLVFFFMYYVVELNNFPVSFARRAEAR